MALRWSRNMDYLGCANSQRFLQIRKALADAETFTQLLGHEQFPIAESYDLAIRHPLNRRDMLICHLPASNNCYTKHCLKDQRSEIGDRRSDDRGRRSSGYIRTIRG